MTLTEGQKQSLRMKISGLNSDQQRLKFMGCNHPYGSKERDKYYDKAHDIEVEIQTLEKLIR